MTQGDTTTHFVLNDYGSLGLAYTEAEFGQDIQAVVRGLLGAHHRKPISVIAVNQVEGWVHDVSDRVASILIMHAEINDLMLTPPVVDFIERHHYIVPSRLRA